MTALTHALKEWAIAVDALLSGEMILLLRKGGIREPQGTFQVPCDRALLFPTLEHQKPEWLKPAYRDRLAGQVSPGNPDQIVFQGWAEITQVIPLPRPEMVTHLLPLHIWTAAWAAERLAWKPDRPIYALLLRAYHLPQPQSLPYQPSYGGCRSWVSLGTDTDPTGSQAVLTDAAYRDLVAAIQAVVGREGGED